MDNAHQLHPDVILMGIQGSGKGTQAERLVTEYGYQLISVGKMLRDEVVKQTKLGKLIGPIIRRGNLIDDMYIEELLRREIITKATKGPLVIDGVPRTLRQLAFLKTFFAEIRRPFPEVMHLYIPHETVLRRLLKRGREDDEVDVIKNRFRIFEKNTQPVIDALHAENKLIEISADQPIENVERIIEEKLRLR